MFGHLSTPSGIEAIPTGAQRGAVRSARVAFGVLRVVDRGCGEVCER